RPAARRGPGRVLQRAFGQLRQPDSGHRRSEPPEPPGCLERPYPGDGGELGNHGAGRPAARRGPGRVLQRAFGQLRQPDSGHRRSEPP
ncbi:hypothetical protein C7E12_20920, partial [Stenotrophomonas maltophilia]